ncbi:MAG: universal stress protein [Ichthyobacteriaceae bacterium]|nr:universal stress protein [Ichthyobacteriaceae bacterium]
MKSILVPIDFSKASVNALKYAIEIAKIYNSKIIVLHTYAQPQSSSVRFNKVNDVMKKTANQELEKLKQHIFENTEHFNSIIMWKIYNTHLSDGIDSIINDNNVDLIIMGATGTSYLEKLFLGSNTYKAIKDCEIPVLAIPCNSQYKGVKHIIFASDLDYILSTYQMSLLAIIARKSNAKITVINIQSTEAEIEEAKKLIMNFNKEHSSLTKEFDISFNFIKRENIADGINISYINNKADLLVMVKQSHSIIHNIFNTSVTKQLVHEAKLPLLTLK